MSQRKVLILCQEESTRAKLEVNQTIKKLGADGATLKWATFDGFQEGKRNGTFDAVFAIMLDMSGDDLGMSEEFYQYYASAPLFFAFTEGDEEVSDVLKGWNDKVTIKVLTEDNHAESIATSYVEVCTEYAKLLEDDVKPAFKEFDIDGSGFINKAELQQLSKKLGNELSDGDLETALKDLDLNGDGVIDMDEFARWYFSGMKSYGQNKRSMLKFHGHATKILQKTQEQAKLALVGQELKTKTHKFAVGFNDPGENAGLKIDYNLHIGGSKQKETLSELSGWLSGTAYKKGTDWLEQHMVYMHQKSGKVFLQIKVSTSNAEEKAAKFKEIINKALEFINDAEEDKKLLFIPQIKAIDNNIIIGLELVQNERKIYGADFQKHGETGLVDLIDMFREVDQNISCQIALGTDVKSVLSEEEKETPLIKHLAKGFKVSSQITLVSNLKKAIAEMLKSDNEEEQYLGQKLMMIAPAFIFGINANMNIEFDDFEEVAEHPMAAPAMATLEQLFEGLMEDTPDAFLNKKLDMSDCRGSDANTESKVSYYEKHKKRLSLFAEIIEAICDLEDPAFNNISIKAASADLPISTDVDIHSESIGSGIKLALKVVLKQMAGEACYIFDKEIEEIYHD